MNHEKAISQGDLDELFNLTGKEVAIETPIVKKTKKLLDMSGLSKEVSLTVGDYGPFALVIAFGKVFAINDGVDQEQMDREQDELFQMTREVLGENFHIVIPCDGEKFLAYLVTGCLYNGFHDKMNFAIKWSRYKGTWFDRPKYRKIEGDLRSAGFQKWKIDRD